MMLSTRELTLNSPIIDDMPRCGRKMLAPTSTKKAEASTSSAFALARTDLAKAPSSLYGAYRT